MIDWIKYIVREVLKYVLIKLLKFTIIIGLIICGGFYIYNSFFEEKEIVYEINKSKEVVETISEVTNDMKKVQDKYSSFKNDWENAKDINKKLNDVHERVLFNTLLSLDKYFEFKDKLDLKDVKTIDSNTKFETIYLELEKRNTLMNKMLDEVLLDVANYNEYMKGIGAYEATFVNTKYKVIVKEIKNKNFKLMGDIESIISETKRIEKYDSVEKRYNMFVSGSVKEIEKKDINNKLTDLINFNKTKEASSSYFTFNNRGVKSEIMVEVRNNEELYDFRTKNIANVFIPQLNSSEMKRIYNEVIEENNFVFEKEHVDGLNTLNIYYIDSIKSSCKGYSILDGNEKEISMYYTYSKDSPKIYINNCLFLYKEYEEVNKFHSDILNNYLVKDYSLDLSEENLQKYYYDRFKTMIKLYIVNGIYGIEISEEEKVKINEEFKIFKDIYK